MLQLSVGEWCWCRAENILGLGVFLVLIKDAGGTVGARLHVLVSDVCQGTKEAG